MTKQDIINQVSSRASLSRAKAEEAVETVIELIKESLGHGEPVILRRFGTFQVRAKSKRVGRNPKRVKKLKFQPVQWFALNQESFSSKLWMRVKVRLDQFLAKGLTVTIEALHRHS